MKKTVIALFPLFLVLFALGCSSGGGGDGIFSPADESNPYGYWFNSYAGSSTASVPADLRAVIAHPTNGKIYAGGYDGLYEIDPSSGVPVFTRITAAFASSTVNSLYLESNGDLLIGTDNGLYQYIYATGLVAAVTGLENKRVLAVTRQNSTTIWAGLIDVATTTQAIGKSENGAAFTFYGTPEGMTASSVVQIHAETDLVIACGVGGSDGLFQFTGSKFKVQDDVLLGSGATLFFKTDSNWFVGGNSAGLKTTSMSGATRTWKTLIESVTPHSLSEDTTLATSRYWLATDQGLFVSYDLTTWTRFDSTYRLSLDNCRAVSARNNQIWVGHPAPAGGLSFGYFKGD